MKGSLFYNQLKSWLAEEERRGTWHPLKADRMGKRAQTGVWQSKADKGSVPEQAQRLASGNPTTHYLCLLQIITETYTHQENRR